jgi:hypothetical protein
MLLNHASQPCFSIIFYFYQELLNHLDAIETLSTLLDSLLDQAKQNVKESLEDFVSDKVRCLGQAIGGYFKCLNVFGVKTRADFESKWTACYQNKNVRETVENLLEVEECWDEFLRNVDRELDKAVETSWQPVSVGSSAPIDMPIFNVDTER